MSNNDSQQSAATLLSNELADLCDSASLSEEGLHEIFQRHGLTPNHNLHNISDYKFFHVACQKKRVTEGIIRCLLDYFPAAASDTNVHGWSPLHSACGNKNNATLEIIQLIVNAAPNSVRSVTNKGSMPLHILCNNHQLYEMAAIEILTLLIEEYPEAVRHANNAGSLPLHLASKGRSLGFCHLLIEAYPGSERITNAKGALPLHITCVKGSLATVEYFYRKYPEAIDHTLTGGFYPIHMAMLGLKQRDDPATAVEIIQFLLNCDPDQKLKQIQGMSLLHYACAMEYNDSNIKAVIEMIKVIFSAHPGSVRSLNNTGNMPLHSLCRKVKVDEEAAIQILKFLLEKHPGAARHANDEGDLPIHIASVKRTPEFCRLLIEAYPGSQRITGARGAPPLHCACLKGSVAMVEYWYNLNPDSIDLTTNNGGYYPIHYAIRGLKHRDNPAAAVEIVQFLLDSDPDQILKQFGGRSLLRCACKRGYNDSNIEAGIQIIKIIFDAHPEAIEDERIASNMNRYHQQVQGFINGELVYARQAKDHHLMTTPDENGQLPLHKALQNNVRLGSIKLLVKGNPSALRTLENFAMPLHIACQHHNSASVVQYLLSLDEAAPEIVDRYGNKVLHYACRGAKHNTIAMLLEKYEAASVSKRNVDGKLPIELLWESNAVEDREGVEYLGSVFQLMRAYPEMVAISSRLTVKQPVDADATGHGGIKRRKFGHDDKEEEQSNA